MWAWIKGRIQNFFHMGGRMGKTKNIGVAHLTQNFQFYSAVVKFRLIEKYGKKERQKIILCKVNFLLLKSMPMPPWPPLGGALAEFTADNQLNLWLRFQVLLSLCWTGFILQPVWSVTGHQTPLPLSLIISSTMCLSYTERNVRSGVLKKKKLK